MTSPLTALNSSQLGTSRLMRIVASSWLQIFFTFLPPSDCCL